MTDEIKSPESSTPPPTGTADGQTDLSGVPLEKLLERPDVKQVIADEAHKRARTARDTDINRIVNDRLAAELAKRDEEIKAQQYLNASDEQVGKAVKDQAKLAPILQKMRDDGVELGRQQTHQGYLNELAEVAAEYGVKDDFEKLVDPSQKWQSFAAFNKAYIKLITPKVAESDPALLDLIQKKKLAESRKQASPPDISRPSGPSGQKMPSEMTPEEFDRHWKANYVTGKWRQTTNR